MTEIKSKKTIIPVEGGYYGSDDFIADCPNDPFIPTIIPPVPRIIAIGDIHGDYNMAIEAFKLAKLINDKMEWIAEPSNTIVVQVGDQIDSCRPVAGNNCHKKRLEGDAADDMNVLRFFNLMHYRASKKGGAVYSLLGNHEIMNTDGNFKYVSFENYQNFNYISDNGTIYRGPEGRKEAFKRGGPVAEILACKRNSVIVIGSNMFVHAGVLPVLARRLDHLNFDSNTKLKYLNSVVRKWLLKKLSDDVDKKNIQLIIDNDKTSPFWTRIYGSIPENTDLNSGKCFNSVKKAIEVFKIGHIVVGHTPQMETSSNGINGTCYEENGENTLFRVDGGFSKAFKIFDDTPRLEVLEIIDDNIFNVLSKKTKF